jgi:hypothetical protein
MVQLIPRVAVLFADPRGPYSGLEAVDVWDEVLDARTYSGPWPVVAHPPCARWSRLAGLTEARWGYKRGDDGGCFESALKYVRLYGGVLEHPAYTKAWPHHGIGSPHRDGGWTPLLCGGFTCYIEQGRYGHKARKATWLYAYGCVLPELKWGYSRELNTVSWCNNKVTESKMLVKRKALTAAERNHTPPEFRDILLSMAWSAQ